MTEPEAPPRMGRPSKFTDDRRQRIVDAVTAGNYLKVAASWAGVSERTLMGWLARGRDAQAVHEAHDESHRYCPSCDLDREPELLPIEQANDDADRRHAQATTEHAARIAQLDDEAPRPEQPAHPGYAALPRCPGCGSDEYPDTWQLDPVEAEYLHFLQSVTRAEHSAEVAAVTAWRGAFADDWRAARDYLVRRRPDRWAATTRISMTTEEAERRIDGALAEAMAALAGDGDLPTSDELSAVLDDALASGALDDLDRDTDDEGAGDA